MYASEKKDVDGDKESTANDDMSRLQSGQSVPLHEPVSSSDDDHESPGFDPYDTASLYIK